MLVSASSSWEISIEAALGVLSVPDGSREELRQQGSTGPPITVEDAPEVVPQPG